MSIPSILPSKRWLDLKWCRSCLTRTATRDNWRWRCRHSYVQSTQWRETSSDFHRYEWWWTIEARINNITLTEVWSQLSIICQRCGGPFRCPRVRRIRIIVCIVVIGVCTNRCTRCRSIKCTAFEHWAIFNQPTKSNRTCVLQSTVLSFCIRPMCSTGSLCHNNWGAPCPKSTGCRNSAVDQESCSCWVLFHQLHSLN